MLTSRPLFLITAACIAGIVCAARDRLSPLTGLVVAVLIILVGCLFPRRKLPRPLIGIVAMFFLFGFARTAMYRQAPPGDISQYAEGKLVYLIGRVVSDVEPIEDSARLVLRVTRVRTYVGEWPAGGDVMVNLRRSRFSGGVIPSFGQEIRIHGRLRTPSEPSNPGAFDYGRYLARKRVFCTLSAYPSEVIILKPAGRSVRTTIVSFRHALSSMAGRLLPPTNGELLLGILLGNYAALPLGVQGAFMRSGTMHLLAASGYNCGVIVLLLGRMLRWITVPRAISHWLLIVAIWGYTLLVGASPSIIRAAVMVTTALIAYLIWRAPDLPNLVLFAALAVLIARPMDLYDTGFQLSFAAVMGLVLVMPLVNEMLRDWLTAPWYPSEGPPNLPTRASYTVARNILLTLAVSIVCILWTAPISAYYFNYLSMVAIPANALVALLVVALTAVGIAVLALGWAWLPLGKLVAPVVTFISGLMLSIVGGLGLHPWSSLSVPSPAPIFLLVYYLILFGVSDYAYRKSAPSQRMGGDLYPGYRRLVDLVTGRKIRA